VPSEKHASVADKYYFGGGCCIGDVAVQQYYFQPLRVTLEYSPNLLCSVRRFEARCKQR
jgi:hypothetical protein